METFNTIIEILNENIIFCLFPLLCLISLIQVIFKNKFKTKQVINLVRWIIVGYTILGIIFFVSGILTSPQDFAFTQRATGPYAIAYWIMLFCATILPFSLLNKKIGLKLWYILLVLLLMRIGFYFEHYVIIVTSFHRDYSPSNNNSYMLASLIQGISFSFVKGFILVVVLLSIFELIGKYKTAHNTR